MTPVALPPREKGPYPSSEAEQLEVMHLNNIDEKLKAGNRKVYAIEKDTEKLKQRLKELPKGFFHRKERKELEDKIASDNMRLEKEKSKLDAIPTMNGFANVATFKKALKKAKADLTEKEKLQEEWRRPESKPEAAFFSTEWRNNIMARLTKYEKETWILYISVFEITGKQTSKGIESIPSEGRLWRDSMADPAALSVGNENINAIREEKKI